MLLDNLRLRVIDFQSEGDYFKRLLALKWIFDEGCKEDLKNHKKEENRFKLILFGMVNAHISNCVERECNCKKVMVSHENISNEDSSFSVHKPYLNEVLRKITLETIQEGANRLKLKDSVILDQAYYYLVKDDKFLSSYMALKQLRMKKSEGYNINRTTSMKLLEKMIESMLRKKCGEVKSGEGIRLYEMIKHNERVEEIKSLISTQTQKQLSLWEFFNQSTWNATELFSRARDIEESRLKIEKIWSDISSTNHSDMVIYLLYGLYSSIINNNFMRSEKLLKKVDVMNTVIIHTTEASLSNKTLYDPKNVLVSMSMDRERLGKVETVSRNVSDHFHYTQQEVVGSNVNMLMSNFLRKRHQGILLQYLSSKKASLFNSQRKSFGYSKKGHVFPIYIYLSVYPSLKNGLSYYGILRPIKEFKDYILLTNNGFVDSCTEDISTRLQIVKPAKGKLHISEICPEMGRVNGAFASIFIQKQSGALNTKQDTKRSKKDDEDDDKLEIAQTSSLFKGADHLATSMLDKYEKTTQAFLLENNHTAPMETMGLETTFRATTLEQGAPPLQTNNTITKKFQLFESSENMAIYEKFTTQGDLLEFYNTETNKMCTYHCIIYEEVYGDSVLRIMRLSQTFQVHSTSFEVHDRSFNQMYTTDRGLTLPEKSFTIKQTIVPTAPPSEQNQENEEETLLDAGIPEERSEIMERSRRSGGGDAPFNLKSSAFYYEGGGSVTSRFQQTDRNQTLMKLHQDLGSTTSRFQGNDSRSIPLFTSHEKSRDQMLTPIPEHQQSLFLHSLSQNYGGTKGQTMPFDPSAQNFPSKEIRSSQLPAQTSESQKPSKSPAFMNTDPIKKFFKQHRTPMKRGDAENASSTGTTTTTSSNRVFGAVEKAFRELDKINKYGTWFYLGLTLFIAAFALLIVYFVIIKIELQRVQEDSQSMFHLGRRVDAFLEVNRNSIILDLFLNGHITRTRHQQDGIVDYVDYVHEKLNTEVQSLNHENNLLTEYIADIPSDLQSELYADRNELQVTNEATDEIITWNLNTFDSVTKIVTFGVEIVSTPTTDLARKATQIFSIIENSFDELYVHLEKPYEIYAAKISNDFDGIDVYFYVCLIIGIAGFVGFFLFSYTELKQLYRDTSRFWEALMRFELKKAEEHKSELRILLHGFQHNKSFHELFTEVNKLKDGEHPSSMSHNATMKIGKQKDSFAFLKKSHDWRSSRTYLPTFIPLVLAFITFLMSLGASKILLGSQHDERMNFVDELKVIFDSYHLQSLTTTMIYQFIRTKGTAIVQGAPIKQELDKNIEQLANINTFITDFQQHSDEISQALLNSNLCNSVFSKMNQTTCTGIAQGANTKGIAGIVSFLASAIAYVRDYFDTVSTSPTVIDDMLSLPQFKEIEIEFDFINAAFNEVEENLFVSDEEKQSDFSATFFIIVIVILIIEGVFWAFMYRISYMKLRVHKDNHALVLKNIPVTLIWESKLIRTYIFTLFRGSVHSVKYNN